MANKNPKADDLYIALIKYGKEKLTEGVTFREAQQHLTEAGFDFQNTPDLGNFFRDAFLHIFGTEQEKVNGFHPPVNQKKFLGAEAYFNLLDHEELQHARESSTEAKKMAIQSMGLSRKALWISALLALFSLLLSMVQIWHTTDVRIIEEQFERLKLAQ